MAALSPGARSDFESAYERSPLANLTKAFEITWDVLTAHDPFRDTERDEDLKLALRGKLLALAGTGLTDPEELRKLALEALPLTRSSQ